MLSTLLGEPPEIAADVAAFFDTYARRVPPLTAFGLRACVWAVVWAPLLFMGKPVPASRLPEPERARYLSRFARSRLYLVREALFLLKTVALLGWGAHPRVRARLGIPPVSAAEIARKEGAA